MKANTTISCPNCKCEINVNDVLYHQLEDELKSKNLEKQKELEKQYSLANKELEKKEELIKLQKEKYDEELKKATLQLVKIEKEKLQSSIKKELEEEQAESIELLKKELNDKTNKVKELNNSKIEIERLKREKEEIESKVKADAAQELNDQIKSEREKILKDADVQNELKFKQKDEQLNQLKEQMQIMQRKAEQGSMQLQGEVQELAIEEYLTTKFPFDTIEEIKKGARGGDCIQVVNTRENPNCGNIYYESKRTKDFQKTWIEKFKVDMRNKNVDIGVLVTQVMPNELDRMGIIDGVWVCTFDEFKSLSAVLRESIIKINEAKKSQENRSDKMGLLYNFLTSNEFKMQVEGIVEGFTKMQSDLDSEKRSMQRIWKQREKQIEKVIDNTVNMYGSIKGIAGNAIGNVKSLELPYQEKDI